MTVVTSRADFEKLMVLRMDEAKLFLAQKDWDGATTSSATPWSSRSRSESFPS